MHPFVDLHTHHRSNSEEVINVYNLLLHDNTSVPAGLFSAGLHPWFANSFSLEELKNRLKLIAINQNLVAFGETGLDKACKTPFQIQLDVFETHLKSAVEQKKPVIIHCVKAWDELIETSKNYQTINILHGFNGSMELTQRLVKKGFHFSIGNSILNPSAKIHTSIHLIPCSSIFCETDETEATIQSVYAATGSALNLSVENLKATIHENFLKLKPS